jgi:hypothetical protein
VFEAEWRRAGVDLRTDLEAPKASALHGVHPAAVRAAGEAALFQARVFYEASLDYGRNTTPESGFFYIGAARAQAGMAALCRSLSRPSALPEPALRPLATELDVLEGELLAAYRPPASIDRHPEFIRASAGLKEARELDAAGLRYGALYRYLASALRVAQARAGLPAPDPAALLRRLDSWSGRLAADKVDHSLGRLFLELAQASRAVGAPDELAVAGVIAEDVLPRYLAALQPPTPRPTPPSPEVTVTLVRWPYT